MLQPTSTMSKIALAWCLVSLATVIGSVGSAQSRFPPSMVREWIGMVNLRTRDDGSFAVLLIDLVGGIRGQTPGSAPDGMYDWVFWVLGPCGGPRSFSGMASLYPSGGDFANLNAVEVVPDNGPPFAFHATIAASVSGTAPSSRVQRLVTLGRAVPKTGSYEELFQRTFESPVPMLQSAACPERPSG